MSAPGIGTPAPSNGDRWNVNLPAVIGVVFVFLVAVIVWVIATGGDDVAAPGVTTAPSTTAPTSPTDVPGTTSPAPMPSTTDATSDTTTTDPTDSTAPTTVPVTAAPGAGPDAVPGDLGIAGRPMQQPSCDGSYITVIASALGDSATAGGIAGLLEQYPGSEYLRTDQTCPSLRADVDGAPIYVVYFGPFAFDSDACAARANGPDGAYARMLSTEVGPNHSVACT
jgi:serine/threonine-protein kinase